MAYEHLRSSLTKGNLWLYVLAVLKRGEAAPVEIRKRVQKDHGFSPAAITFHSVLYKMRMEGLVRKSTDSFRSKYEITQKGIDALVEARTLLEGIRKDLE